MATVQDRAARPSPLVKNDAAVEARLARARKRIRLLDLGVALLGLLVGTLTYALAMALCDRAFQLSPAARQVWLGGFVLAALGYLGFFVVRPLLQQINPYYAAQQIEQTIPGAKNSVVNWLDLHERDLPPAIHGAVSQRAARDIARADLEQAVSSRRLAWIGGIAGGSAIFFLVAFFAVGPEQFVSLLGRAFLPFSSGGITARTQLTLLRPEGGDMTVPAGRSVAFAVHVEGKVPNPKRQDALKLLYRYRQTDAYEVQLLEHDNGREWGTTIPGSRVQNDFWYRISGGDFETPEYLVSVRTAPLVKSHEVTYHYRPYLHWADDSQTDPNLKEMCGTQVILVAKTNRAVREGRIELENAKKTIPGERIEKDPHALRFQLVLDESDRYRIFFTSTDSESNEPAVHTITVIPDYAPQVRLTAPKEDEIKLPANDLLELAGAASDDIGVKSLTLRMRLSDGPDLQPKVYREGKSFQLSDGGYPKSLDYEDSVELAKVKDADGKPLELKPGMVLEYWLEASDAYDYPAPHVVESKPRKRVIIVEPEKDPQKQQQKRAQAAQKQKQHEAKQDDKLKQEDEQRQRDAKAGNQPNEQQRNPEQEQKDQQTQKEADKVKDLLDKNQQPKEGQAKDEGQKDKGDAKDGGKPEQPNEQGTEGAKKEGQPDPKQPPGEARDAGQNQQQDQSQAKGRNNTPEQQQPGDAKPDQQPAAKGGGKGQGKQEPGAQEPQGAPKDDGQQGGDRTAQGQPRSAPPEKPDGTDTARAESKGADKRNSQAQARDAKPEDVDRLAKELQNGDANQKRDAAQQLDQINRNAGDPKARDAARQALEKSNRLPEQNAKPEDAAQNAQDLKSNDPTQRQEAAERLDRMARNAKDPKTREAARQAKEQNEMRPGDSAKPGDVEQQAKDLQSGDPKQQQQAAEKLDKMARNAKDERVRDAARKELEKAKQQPGQDAKPDDVARQEKQLEQPDPQQQREAADKLEQISRNAKDQQARDAARKALEKFEKRPQEHARPEDVAREQKDLQGGDEKAKEQAAERLEQMSRNAKDEQVREAAGKALEQAKKTPGQDAKPEDVARHEKDLQQDDPQKQRDAADKLEQFLKNAKDEKTKEQARKALEDALKRAHKDQSPAPPKEQPTQEPPPAPPKKPPQEPAAIVKDDKNNNQGQQKEGNPKDATQVKDRGKTDGPLAPWMPGTGDGRDAPAFEAPAPPGGPGDPRHRDRAGNLLLRDLKNFDNKIRDEMGWTPEHLQAFRKNYEDLMKRRQADPRMADADKLLGPQRGGNVSNLQSRPVKPGQGSPVDARHLGRGQPPPGYLDAEREFRRLISDLDTPPERK